MNGLPWPLGINTATRREAFARLDLFDNRLGRKAGTLRNQAQREWHLRARAAGLRGFYIPDMVVHHVVESERLQKRYFRRWFYWHGISRAILFAKLGVDMDAPDNSQLDFSTGSTHRRRPALHVPIVGGPRHRNDCGTAAP